MKFSELNIGDIFRCPPSSLAMHYCLSKNIFIKTKVFYSADESERSAFTVQSSSQNKYGWCIPANLEVIKILPGEE